MIAQKYNEIPKELLVYLLDACKEFEKAKHNYLIWLQNIEQDLIGKSEEEKKAMLANPDVPNLIVKVPYDEDESEAIQNDLVW